MRRLEFHLSEVLILGIAHSSHFAVYGSCAVARIGYSGRTGVIFTFAHHTIIGPIGALLRNQRVAFYLKRFSRDDIALESTQRPQPRGMRGNTRVEL